MPENTNVAESHGCIVCGKLYSILAIYTPEGKLVDWILTSLGGHRVLDERQPLVACDTHPAAKVEAAHQRWRAELSRAGGTDDGEA